MTKSVSLRLDGNDEHEIGSVSGSDYHEIMGGLAQLLREAASELDRLRVAQVVLDRAPEDAIEAYLQDLRRRKN